MPSRRGKTLLVVGTGRGVFHQVNDLDALESWDGDKADVMAIAHMGMFLPRVDHFFSCHTHLLEHIKGVRKHDRRSPIQNVHALKQYGYDSADYLWDVQKFTMNSGIMGAQIGRAMGYRRVILAGVNLDTEGHFYDGDETTHYFQWPLLAMKRNKDRFPWCRSMGGYTAEILGEPDGRWLSGADAAGTGVQRGQVHGPVGRVPAQRGAWAAF